MMSTSVIVCLASALQAPAGFMGLAVITDTVAF
jgi:hypothetical protein